MVVEMAVLKKIDCKGDIAKKDVEMFRDHIFWLKIVHYTFKELFEKTDTDFLMRGPAAWFFHDLNTILLQCFLLECAKVTDPPTSGKYQNFTVDNLIETVDWPREIRCKLKALSKKINDFSEKYIKDIRNKRIAHRDKEALRAQSIMGQFPKGEDEEFLSALTAIVKLMYQETFEKPLGSFTPSSPGDVLDLKRALAKAVALDKLYSESDGPEKKRIYAYYQEALKSAAIDGDSSLGTNN